MKKIIELILTFLKIGVTTFGGGYAMIANIHDEVVERKKWLTADELVEMTAVSESTPGPIAINLATYIGYKRKGFRGALAATLSVVFPSLVIIYIISLVFNAFISNEIVAAVFSGIKCAVAFLILKAAFGLLKNVKKNAFSICLLVICAALTIASEYAPISVSSIVLILCGAVLGMIFYSVCDKKASVEKTGNGKGKEAETDSENGSKGDGKI